MVTNNRSDVNENGNGNVLSVTETAQTAVSNIAPLQVNESLNCQQITFTDDIQDNKAKVTELTRQCNFARNWQTRKVNPRMLASLLADGVTVRPGIKEGGNGRDNLNSKLYWLFLDFDKNSNPDKMMAKLPGACIKYYTMSHREDFYKFRLVYRLNRGVTAAEYDLASRRILDEIFPEADRGANGSGKFFYGTWNSDWVLVEDENAILDIDQFIPEPISSSFPSEALEEDIPVTPTRVHESDEDRIITEKVCQYLYEEVFLPNYNGAADKFYSIGFWDDWEFHSRSLTPEERKQGVIAKWDGSNPFSDTNQSRKSLCISHFRGRLPVFYDRAHGFHEEKDMTERNGGTFISFFYELNKRYNQKCRYGSLRASFKSVVRDICKTFGVENFDFKQAQKARVQERNESVLDFLRRALKNRFFTVTTDSDKSTSMLMFHPEHSFWLSTHNYNDVYRECVLPLLIEEFGEREIEGNRQVSSYVLSALKLDKFSFSKETYPVPSRNHFAFPNGVFGVKNKLLLSWQDLPEPIFNFHKYPIPFEHVDDHHPVIQAFETYLKTWTNNHEVFYPLLRSWLIINMMGKGWRTECFLLLFGEAGVGKSTYCLLIHNAMTYTLSAEGEEDDDSDFAKKPQAISKYAYSKRMDPVTLFSGYSHATAALEYCRHLFIDEFQGNTKQTSAQLIKQLTGNKHSNSLPINPKGKEQREIPFYAGITANCQDLPNLGNDDGKFRRAVCVNCSSFTPLKDASPLNLVLDNPHILFMWALKQDLKQALDTFKSCSKAEAVVQDARTLRKTSHPLALWIDDCVEITNDKGDIIITNALYESYVEYATEELKEKNPYGKFYWAKETRKILKSKHFGYNWNASISPPEAKSKRQRCFKGLKLKVLNMAQTLTNNF